MKRGWRDAGCGNSCATPHNIEGEASGLFAPHEVNTAVRVSMTTMIACVIVLALISRVSAQQWEWVMPFTVDVPGNVVTVCVSLTIALTTLPHPWDRPSNRLSPPLTRTRCAGPRAWTPWASVRWMWRRCRIHSCASPFAALCPASCSGSTSPCSSP